VTDNGRILIQTPQQPPGRDVDKAPLNVLLVLRAIAMSDQITRQDLVDNLRLPHGAVGSALHYAETRGWLEQRERDFRLSWDWYSTITRVLARQNLLAR
jgi:DNA-binding IclR family transcriptional regulator